MSTLHCTFHFYKISARLSLDFKIHWNCICKIIFFYKLFKAPTLIWKTKFVQFLLLLLTRTAQNHFESHKRPPDLTLDTSGLRLFHSIICAFFSTDIQHLFDRTSHSQMRKAASGLCPLHRRLQLNSLEMTGLLLHCSSLYQLLAKCTNSQNKPHFYAVRAFQLYVVTAARVVRTDQASERCEICYHLAAAQTSGPAITCMHVQGRSQVSNEIGRFYSWPAIQELQPVAEGCQAEI